jgi:hypothetical protein
MTTNTPHASRGGSLGIAAAPGSSAR